MQTFLKRRSKIGRTPLFAAVAGAVVFLSLIFSVVHFTREFQGAVRLRAAANESHETRTQIQRAMLLMVNAETGQRGYVITGDRALLRPYEEAGRQLDAQLETLRQRTSNDPEAAVRMERFGTLVEAKRAELATTIQARRSGGLAAAQSLILEGEGDRLMAQIRDAGAAMVAHEAARLDAATQGADQRRQRIEFLLVLLLGTMLLLSVIAGVLLWRYLLTRGQLLDRLRATTARQEAIFDSAIDGIITLNPSGSIESLNQAAQQMFGYAAPEVERRDIALLIDMAGDGETTFLQRLGETQGALEGGIVREMTGKRRDGAAFPVDVALGALEQPTGVHVVAIVRDISERRRVEAMKEEFVSTVSHELRTPMTSIAGSLGLLAGGAAGELPEKAMRLVSIAQANSQRLVRLINDILDIEKIESGKLTLAADPLDLRAIAERSIEGAAGYAAETGVVLNLLDGPEAPIRGDGDRLIQVATNLLSNAMKFSPKGGEVIVSVLPERRIARLSVRDFGPGVPEGFRARIFSKFAQADGSDARRRGGTGLGLAISKEIAERHGGRLWFESSPGEGATFHLDLPLRLADRNAPNDLRPRILICEDDPEAADMLCDLLEADGFAPEVVGTAEAALRATADSDHDAMLVDLTLPDGDGITLIRTLRERPATHDLPIIVVSGDAARGRARGGALEVLDWMDKPIDRDRLRAVIVRALNGAVADRPRLLHVEDDPDVLHLVAAALADIALVDSAHSLAAARRSVAINRPAGVILDLGLPDGSGLDLLPELADDNGRTIPVIVYSAQEGDAATTQGVDAVLTKSRTSLTALARTVRRLTLNPQNDEADG